VPPLAQRARTNVSKQHSENAWSTATDTWTNLLGSEPALSHSPFKSPESLVSIVPTLLGGASPQRRRARRPQRVDLSPRRADRVARYLATQHNFPFCPLLLRLRLVRPGLMGRPTRRANIYGGTSRRVQTRSLGTGGSGVCSWAAPEYLRPLGVLLSGITEEPVNESTFTGALFVRCSID
jgi:hypothetical protein